MKRFPLRMRRWVVTAVTTGVLSALSAAPALAAQQWEMDSLATTNVAPGGILDYRIQVKAAGDQPMDGSPTVVTATLPRGFTVADPTGPVSDPRNPHFMSTNGIPLNYGIVDFGAGLFMCTQMDDATPLAGGETEFICRNPAPSGSPRWQVIHIPVSVDPGLAEGSLATAHFRVEGGGAAPDTIADPTRISSTPARFGIDGFDGQVVDRDGNAYSQAGGHPYSASVSIDFNTLLNPVPLGGPLWPVDPVKDVYVDLPPGLIGNPTSVDRCTAAQLAYNPGVSSAPTPLCPPTSQVGTVFIRLQSLPTVLGPYPVYNMEPPPNVPARFGFTVISSIVSLDAQLRSDGDYGLTIAAENIPEALGIVGTTVTFWGVPADPSHDNERACPGENAPADDGPTCRSGAGLLPLLRIPTACTNPGVGLPTTARVDSWPNPGVFSTSTWFSHEPPGFPFPVEEQGPQLGPTGCARVPFDPKFRTNPQIPAVNSTSGFSFDLSIPQTNDPDLIDQGDLKRAVVTLPSAVHVSASSADGLQGCTPAQIELRSTDDPTCPRGSRIGDVTIDTPLLAEPLRGSVFLASPHDNPFGTLLSIYLVAEGPGLVVKLAGKVEANQDTGQLTATFDDNPQLPFDNLHLAFKSGPRAPLTAPAKCGTYTTQSELTSWSGKTVAGTSSFTVSHDGNGAPCPAPQFTPKFGVGTADPIAGRSSAFNLSLSRDEDDEEFKALSIDMPTGLTGRIASADLCPVAAANAGTCSDASKVGSVTVGAGAGPNPFYITNGRVYITGPYKGAPFGLSIVVPAVAGPFDLGNVVVRSAIFVDQRTAELRVVSDPLPTILQGIPLNVRDIRVSIDRKDFFLNPTSCAEKTIRGSIDSVDGKTAGVSSRFQVGECSQLALKPKMTLTVGGPGHTHRNASAPFKATLTQSPGQSNLRQVEVTLPKVLNSHLPAVERACRVPEYEAGRCKAKIGTAVAVTPLLKDPLRGNAYFVRRQGARLPDIVVALRGQVSFDLIGRIDIPRDNSLKTMFNTVPDVPIKSFTLSLVSGKYGPVGTTTNLCSRRARAATAAIDFVGQNGRVVQREQRLVIRGCDTGRGGRKASRSSHRRGR